MAKASLAQPSVPPTAMPKQASSDLTISLAGASIGVGGQNVERSTQPSLAAEAVSSAGVGVPDSGEASAPRTTQPAVACTEAFGCAPQIGLMISTRATARTQTSEMTTSTGPVTPLARPLSASWIGVSTMW